MSAPTGFVAICRCGATIGAMDYTRTDREEAAELLRDWLLHGCTVEPRFGSEWSVKFSACNCQAAARKSSEEGRTQE